MFELHLTSKKKESAFLPCIFPLNYCRSFKSEEVEELIPYLYAFTLKTVQKIYPFQLQLSQVIANPKREADLLGSIKQQQTIWKEKMRRLGPHPVKLYKVKFESIEGTFYWEYPSKVYVWKKN